MKTKVWKQTDIKPKPMTPAERQAKRKGKLLKDSEDLKELMIEISKYLKNEKPTIEECKYFIIDLKYKHRLKQKSY